MGYWKTGYRTIDGSRRKVRKLRQGGKIVAVRIANRPHYTDRTARKKGIAHVRGRVNYPNKAARKNVYRRG